MNEYIFRIPADCPELSFAGLLDWLNGRHERTIGTTVRVYWIGLPRGVHAALPPALALELYGLKIARIMPGMVHFPGPDDPHVATSAWIGRIVRDNGIGCSAYRIRRRKTDGPGPAVWRGQAGLLCIDGDRERPVFGESYPVNKEPGESEIEE